MKFFELHVSDYQRKTAHLSLAEHGAYMLMLQLYYGTEKPLPPDPKLVSRLVRAHSKAERSAVVRVLQEFWTKTPEGYVNARASQVLEDYLQWVASQRAKGRAGANSRWHSSSHSTGDGTCDSSGDNQTHGRTMASHSDLPLRPKTEEHPQPPQGGRIAVNGLGRKTRGERNLSRAAWRESAPAIESIRGTTLTWNAVRERLTDPAALQAITTLGEGDFEQGCRLIADRDRFTTADIETRFREAYERAAHA